MLYFALRFHLAPSYPLCICVWWSREAGGIQYFPAIEIKGRAEVPLLVYISKLLLSICRLLIENNTIFVQDECARVWVCVWVCVIYLSCLPHCSKYLVDTLV